MRLFTRHISLLVLPAVLFSSLCFAQSDAEATDSDGIGLGINRAEAIAEYRNTEARELTVLSDTLQPEQIDRAVLNRLMQEIATDPTGTRTRIRLSDKELQELFIILSNARGFINGSEMANVRAMCAAWDASTSSGESRVAEAIAAFEAREQLTQNFIAKYYGVVLFDIEATLDEASLARFRSYMDDRRRRLANAGLRSWGSPVQNIRAGTDTIKFHCR
ncbi:MAG: hypothetical protein DHS20C12_15470 [Pseudohongiella sp.]|nr:MAG: hypothetical protein DHS20C12_15470 [Pseudohongiella sp.]